MSEELPQPEYPSRKQVAVLLGVSEKWLAQSGKDVGPAPLPFRIWCDATLPLSQPIDLPRYGLPVTEAQMQCRRARCCASKGG